MKKLLLTGIAAASVFLLGACGSSNDTTTSAADKEEVIVGLDDTFVPMGFKDDQGNIVGFDVDLATAILDLTGTKVKFQPIDCFSKNGSCSTSLHHFVLKLCILFC